MDLDQCISCGCAANVNMRDLCRSCEGLACEMCHNLVCECPDPEIPLTMSNSQRLANEIFSKFPLEQAVKISACLHLLTEAVKSFDKTVVIESAKILLELSNERTKSP